MALLLAIAGAVERYDGEIPLLVAFAALAVGIVAFIRTLPFP